jgi:phospholipase D1/2
VNPLLEVGSTCFRRVPCNEAALLVDASDYYRAFCQAAQSAERRLLLAGWQFDSNVHLLRGEDARTALTLEGLPSELLPFLDALCRRRPELEVLILAWNFNPVFALEREWLQQAVFGLGSPKNLRFRFDSHHPLGASHHQKIAIIDDRMGFAGGIDLANSRWDDRAHRVDNPLRVTKGEPQKPYHDAMVVVTGSAACELEGLFIRRWQAATGETLEPLCSRGRGKPESAAFAGALSIEASEVGICRTDRSGSSLVSEILSLYERSIAAAEHSIYIETQYFTARAIRDALVLRMQATDRPPLDLVLVMPLGADTPKERVVLGAAQERLLLSLSRTAERHGCRFRIYCSAAAGSESGTPKPTFIHSKVLVVDDRLLAVGSANLTNRSLLLDTELTLAFEDPTGRGPLSRSIAAIRAELLGEHAGVAVDREFFRGRGLTKRLDALAARGQSRLFQRPIDQELATSDPLLRLEYLFDPDKPLSEVELAELVAPTTRDSSVSLLPDAVATNGVGDAG